MKGSEILSLPILWTQDNAYWAAIIDVKGFWAKWPGTAEATVWQLRRLAPRRVRRALNISKRDGWSALVFAPRITKAAPADGRKKQGMWLEIESCVNNIRSMKTTIDLPENEMQEAMKYTGAKTKTDAVNRAVADYNRRQRLAELAGRMGTFKDMMTRKDLREMRETS